ncbi:periplasmic binding component of a glutamate/aspartate transporter [Buttiauxella brennerae ATCC 51605]|uniref:Periplasmic binding component of a glutamate/aspartate transporter n=1 Tax=Buttiauxella brennerae ATCC 51605 TaxID=1354251 RepID=A0A1B7IP29_9ENTR|nr:transporter substrate-binding domain-containing protein [Buttiauxella brennerae]OAT31430.1 periplasmic binding component of a glutamate/aspartate transporter [Buttiauxella brennerae ATCC 51605]
MTKTVNWLSICVFFVSGLFVQTVEAQASKTIESITNSHQINIAYRDAPPFSYKTADGKVVGYVIDLCNVIVSDISKHLNIRDLKVNYIDNKYLPERDELLRDQKVDMICSVNANVAEWKNLADYSIPYTYSWTRFATLKDKKITNIEQLAGHTVSVTAGSVDSIALNKANRELGLNILVITTPTMEKAFELMHDGTTSAAFINDISLKEIVEGQTDKSSFYISAKGVGKPQFFVILLPNGDNEFKSLVNQSLCKIRNSHDFAKIHDIWFNSPIPYLKLNLQSPFSEEMEQELALNGNCNPVTKITTNE